MEEYSTPSSSYKYTALKRGRKVLPIILRGKSKYTGLAANKIEFSIVRATAKGVQLKSPIQKSNTQKIGYHRNETEEEKGLLVVIKGVLEKLSTDQVKKELTSLGFHPRIIRERSKNLKSHIQFEVLGQPVSENGSPQDSGSATPANYLNAPATLATQTDKA